MENFDQELSYGVIRKSEYHEVLLRLREIAKTLQEDKVTTSRLTEIEKALTELLTASYRHGQGRRGGDLDSMLAQLKIDVNTRTQIARMFAQLAADRPVSSLIPESAAKAEATADSVSLLRNAAIAAYLQGRYREAAGLFNRLARLAPDEPMLANWQQHLSLELSRLGQAPPGTAGQNRYRHD
jgi:TolA-binding protein